LTVSFEEQQRLWALDNRRDISEYDATAQDTGTTVASLISPFSASALIQQAGAREVLEALEIEDLLERGIRFLSSGQIRKVLIARALLSRDPARNRLVILDDPLEAIDPRSQSLVRRLLQQSMDAQNATVLLCRREQEILPGITHLALMEGLQLIARGKREEVAASDAYRRIARPRVEAPERLPGSLEQSNPSPAVAPIRLEEVSAGYGERLVLDRVTWTMEVGHHTLIEGPNGCGKSTLLSLIDGENHKAYGQNVVLFGIRRGSGESVWDIKSRFGVVSNEIHNRYVRGWKVIDVIVSGFFDSVGLYDESGASQIEMARRWLATFGMERLARDYFHEISFGQQRLALLARAMVKGPDVLVLDEPCVGLDDYYRQLVLKTIDRIAETTATQIIYVSHTRGEEPACINQRLRFEPRSVGGYQLVVTGAGNPQTGAG
jgi:molybdate transport system ATP-binding protein